MQKQTFPHLFRLLVRSVSVFRRFTRCHSLHTAIDRDEIGHVVIDSEKYAVYTDTEYIELPKKEFDLLFKLLSYPDRIFSKEQLLDSIWGMNAESGEETVKTHISRIRNRLKNITEFNIVTIKGLGYKADIKNG